MAVIATDNFTGADASPIGGNWTTAGGSGAMRRVSNTIATVTAATESAAYWNANSFPNDQYSKYTETTVGTNGDQGAVVRCATSGTQKNYYWASSFTLNPDNEGLNKFVNNNFTHILTQNVTNFVNGDIIGAEAQGTTIRFLKNNVVQGSVTDSSHASGAAGIFMFESDCRGDNWEGGDFTTGEVVSDNYATIVPRAEVRRWIW